VIAQGILGGITGFVLTCPSRFVGACGAGANFLRHCRGDGAVQPQEMGRRASPIEFDQRAKLIHLNSSFDFVLYVQLILGAMFRHHGMSWCTRIERMIVSFVLA